jgi:hypothetical protein
MCGIAFTVPSGRRDERTKTVDDFLGCHTDMVEAVAAFATGTPIRVANPEALSGERQGSSG